MAPQCNPKNSCICQPKRDKRVKVKYKVIIILNKPSILNIFLKRVNFNQEWLWRTLFVHKHFEWLWITPWLWMALGK